MLRFQSNSGSHSNLFHKLFNSISISYSSTSISSPRSRRFLPDGQSSDIVAYTVKPTDTLTGLAITYNMKPEQIRQFNQLYSEHLLPGQILYLRPPGVRTPPISNFRELRLQDKNKKKRSSTLDDKISKSAVAVSEIIDAKKGNDDTRLSPRNSADFDKKEKTKSILLPKSENVAKVVVKEPARFCSESFNVEGTLTITEEVFVFEPRLDDPFVQRDGVLPFQVYIHLKDIFDCQIVKENSKYLFDTSLEVSCLENDGSAPTYDFILQERILRTVYKQLMKWTSMKKANDDEDQNTPKEVHHTVDDARQGLQDLSKLSLSPAIEDKSKDVGLPTLDRPSALLNNESLQKLVRHLPERYRFNNWKLLYGTQVHGISLNTFYAQVEDRGPTIIVVEDKNRHLFGGFATESWRIEPRFYGSGECFLFKLKSPASPKSKAYHWTGKNSNFMCSRRDFIAMGGGSFLVSGLTLTSIMEAVMRATHLAILG